MSFKITTAVIDPVARKRELEKSEAGACVTFEGWVRNHNEGEAVLAIGGLILPCESAVPCGGVAVHRLNLDDLSVEILPDIVQKGSPHVYPMDGTRYLLIGSAVYGYYDLASGPLEF